MEDLGKLAQRLEKLEASNKRLKLLIMAVSFGLVGAVLMGAAQAKRIVSAEKFVFVEQGGKERLSLDSSPQGPIATLYDINGKASFKVLINKDGYFQMLNNKPAAAAPAPKPQ